MGGTSAHSNMEGASPMRALSHTKDPRLWTVHWASICVDTRRQVLCPWCVSFLWAMHRNARLQFSSNRPFLWIYHHWR